MKIAVRCLLVLAIVCKTFATDNEFKNLQIEPLHNCYMSRIPSILAEHTMICPGFKMEMDTFNMTKKPYEREHYKYEQNPQLGKEFRSTVTCSNPSPPYKYLRQSNSKRNSLTLKDCSPPENGSFGDGWPNLEIFIFQNYENIAPLTRQHFSGLNNMWKLMLYMNSTHQFEDDAFGDLVNLTEIRLAVRNANKNMFKNLTKLEWLHLSIGSRDSLNDFDMSGMGHLTAFKTLELTSNNFTRLTKRFFEGCANVETLLLKRNTIDTIDGNAFEPLTNLKHVAIRYNDLASLPEGLFSKNTKLETFYYSPPFRGSSITSLPSAFFSNLPNLREITIESELTSIPANLIRGSTNLEQLHLQLNRLAWVPTDLLQNHTKLKTVELYGNQSGRRPLPTASGHRLLNNPKIISMIILITIIHNT